VRTASGEGRGPVDGGRELYRSCSGPA